MTYHRLPLKRALTLAKGFLDRNPFVIEGEFKDVRISGEEIVALATIYDKTNKQK